jgi:hypothetical protein
MQAFSFLVFVMNCGRVLPQGQRFPSNRWGLDKLRSRWENGGRWLQGSMDSLHAPSPQSLFFGAGGNPKHSEKE